MDTTEQEKIEDQLLHHIHMNVRSTRRELLQREKYTSDVYPDW